MMSDHSKSCTCLLIEASVALLWKDQVKGLSLAMDCGGRAAAVAGSRTTTTKTTGYIQKPTPAYGE